MNVAIFVAAVIVAGHCAVASPVAEPVASPVAEPVTSPVAKAVASPAPSSAKTDAGRSKQEVDADANAQHQHQHQAQVQAQASTAEVSRSRKAAYMGAPPAFPCPKNYLFSCMPKKTAVPCDARAAAPYGSQAAYSAPVPSYAAPAQPNQLPPLYAPGDYLTAQALNLLSPNQLYQF